MLSANGLSEYSSCSRVTVTLDVVFVSLMAYFRIKITEKNECLFKVLLITCRHSVYNAVRVCCYDDIPVMVDLAF